MLEITVIMRNDEGQLESTTIEGVKWFHTYAEGGYSVVGYIDTTGYRGTLYGLIVIVHRSK